MIMYKIVNINDKKLFWSNCYGWTERRNAELFTTEERNKRNLPIEGKWIKIKIRD